MRKTFKQLVAVLTIAGFGAGTAAQAQTVYDLTYYLTTTGTTLATTGGVVALIYFLTKKPANNANPADQHETTKAAQRFLEQNTLQLAQDLNSGNGPIIDELATGLRVRAEHKVLFAEALRSHRVELLGLANPEHLTESRTVAFTQKLVDIMESDSALRGDLHAFTDSVRIN